MTYVKELELPEKEFFEKNLKAAEKLSIEIRDLWRKCDNEEEDFSLTCQLVEDKESSFLDYFSLYALVRYFDKNIERKEFEQYDCTKICISKETDDLLKEHDKKIIKLMNPDFTEEVINKEISFMYLFSGLKVVKNAGNKILFESDFLRENPDFKS